MNNPTINKAPTIEIEQLVPFMQGQITHKQLLERDIVEKNFANNFSWVAPKSKNIQVVLYYQPQFGRIRAVIQYYKDMTLAKQVATENLFVSIPKWENSPQEKKEAVCREILDLFAQKLIEEGYTFEKTDAIKVRADCMYETTLMGCWLENLT